MIRGGKNISPGVLALARETVSDLSGTILPSALNLVGLAGGFGFHVLMARRLGASAVGLYGLMLSIMNILLLLAIFGTNRSVMRFVASAYGRGVRVISLRSVWLLVMPPTILFAVILVWCAPWIAVAVFESPALSSYLRVAGFIIVFAVPALVWAAAHQGYNRVGLAVMLREVTPVCVAFIGLWLLEPVCGIPLLAPLSYGAGWLVAALAGGFLWVRAGRTQERGGEVTSFPFRELASTSWPMLMTSASFLILGWTDTIMLGLYHDSASVGIYRVALKISVVVTLGAQSLQKLAGPRLAAAFGSGDTAMFEKWLHLCAWGNLVFVVPIALPAILAPGFFLDFFGLEFQSGRAALQWLCWAEIARALFGLPGLLLEMTGYQISYRNAMISAAVLNVILNYLLVPPFGMVGAAVATALSCVLGTVMACWSASTRLHVNTTVFRGFRIHHPEQGMGGASE